MGVKLVTIKCRPKKAEYEANVQGLVTVHCCKCGKLFPVAGNAEHEVRK